MFEWDSEKSRLNFEKHNIAFDKATAIWQSIYLEVAAIAQEKKGETRSATIGLIDGKFYTAIWTWRSNKMRLICVRRSRDGEKKAFQNRFFQDN